jgi:ABC-2 type transport system permease protein
MARIGASHTEGQTGAGIFSRASRQQYAAIVRMRLDMLGHSVRTSRGAFDLVSQAISWGVFALWGLGLATGFGFGTYFAVKQHHATLLLLLLWAALVIWQLVPVMAVSFRDSVDLSSLLRFPLGFGAYSLLFLIFGLLDVATILGTAALAGMAVGAGVADAGMLAWFVPTLALFGVFNLLLTRAIFAWVDRWLAKRRSREILGVCFFLIILGIQLLNPALHGGVNTAHGQRAWIEAHAHALVAVSAWLPPGLVTAAGGGSAALALSLAGLLLYAVAAGALLGLRLGQQYRGESLSEAPARAAAAGPEAREGRALFDVSGPIGAIFVKEARYLMRAYQLIYSLVAPLILVVVFSARHSRPGAPTLPMEFVIPMGAAYAFLGMTRMLYNSLGTDGPGLSFYFTSPVPLRTVMLGKNLFHLTLLLVELVAVWSVAALRVGWHDPQMLVLTLCALVFAIPAEFTAGNILSIQSPYAMNFSKLGRPQGAGANALMSLLVQVVVAGIGAGIFFAAYRLGNLWLAAPAFLVLGLIAALAYWRVLGNVEMLARRRIEPLLEDLAKTVN